MSGAMKIGLRLCYKKLDLKKKKKKAELKPSIALI